VTVPPAVSLRSPYEALLPMMIFSGTPDALEYRDDEGVFTRKLTVAELRQRPIRPLL